MRINRLTIVKMDMTVVVIVEVVEEVWFGLVGFLNVLVNYIAEGPQDRASGSFTCCHT